MRYLFAFALLIALFISPSFAAEPNDTLSADQAFEQLQTYDYGANDKPLRVIELYVGRFATDARRG